MLRLMINCLISHINYRIYIGNMYYYYNIILVFFRFVVKYVQDTLNTVFNYTILHINILFNSL